MKIAQLKVDFRLHGCRSLKEKRHRLAKLRDKFGKHTGLAVCESEHQDSHQMAQWSFVSCNASAQIIEQAFAEIEQYVAFSLDAEVIGLYREWLS